MDRLPGFRDFYPEPVPHRDLWSAALRQHIFDRWRDTARRYSFVEYDGPPLEPLELYTLKSGEEIVGQLYHFVDKGDRAVSLRPEMTPTLARMAAAHLRNYRRPLRWFAIPQLFRYERQQKGRLREHFQFNADILGESDSAADAELIALLIDSLRGLGLTDADFVVRLSSRQVWHDFLQRQGTDPTHTYAFFQAVDKLDREPAEVSDAKLKTLGLSLDAVQKFVQLAEPSSDLAAILDNLSARGLRPFVTLDYQVIRGLAYYTGPVFEAFDRKGEFRAIAGGGRYDRLVGLVTNGKVDLPALGFGMGDVVLTELLRARNLAPTQTNRPDVACILDQEQDRPGLLALVQKLRQAGLSVDYTLTQTSSDKQFKRALDAGARFTLRMLQNPQDGSPLLLRNLQTREEHASSLDDAIDIIRRPR